MSISTSSGFRLATAILAVALLVVGQAGAAQVIGCGDKFPPPVLAFCLVLYARRRGGGVLPALVGQGVVAALAWANQLIPPATGPLHDSADAMGDLFCCGLAGLVLVTAAVAILTSPKRPGVEEPGKIDGLALCGFVVVSLFVIGMIAALKHR